MKRKMKSLRFRWNCIIAGLLSMMMLLVMGYNLYNLYQVNEAVKDNMAQSLHLRLIEVEKDFEKVEDFLIAQNELTTEYGSIYQPGDQLEYYLAQNHIQTSLLEALASYDYMDGFYLYNPMDDSFLIAANKTISAERIAILEDVVRKSAKEYADLSSKEKGIWKNQIVEKENYLIKMLNNYNMYLGAFVSMKHLESWIGMQDAGALTITEKNKPKEGATVWEEGRFGEFCVNLTLEDDLAEAVMKQAGIWLIISAAGILSLAIFVHKQMKRAFLEPVNQLVYVMQQPQEKWKDILEREAPCEEFQAVYNNMNQMIDQIQALDRRVYEENLQKQEITIQYLQLQNNPHFLINCMNLVRSLIFMEEKERAEQVIIEMGKYMRYMMREDYWVSLKSEISHVESYIHLQKYRYEEYLDYQITVENELKEIKIPIMLLQTFVENSVKHQGGYERRLLISIFVEKCEQGMRLCIEDNGDGFTQAVLEKLRSNEPIYNQVGEHVGIYNVCRRLEVLYRGKATICFYNRKSGGAGVEIQLPLRGESI